MSNTESPRSGLVLVVPQGQLELASTSGPGGPEQGGMLSYRDLLQFYVAQTKWPTQAPPALPYDDLKLFYQVHAVVVGAARVVHYVCTLYIDCWLVCILVVTVAP